MSPPVETEPHSWLQLHAAYVTEQLRANGFGKDDAVTRQMLAMGEEVGELIGAYRRWSGNARRTSDAAEVYLELADVVITAYVTAQELKINLDDWCALKLRHIYVRGWRESGRR